MENNIPVGYIAFDKEIALRDINRVRTRGGGKVSQIFYAESLAGQKLIAIVNGKIQRYCDNGTYVIEFDKNYENDLF